MKFDDDFPVLFAIIIGLAVTSLFSLFSLASILVLQWRPKARHYPRIALFCSINFLVVAASLLATFHSVWRPANIPGLLFLLLPTVVAAAALFLSRKIKT